MWRSVPFSFFSRADWQWNQADTFPTCRWSLDLPLPIRERHVYKHSVQLFTPCAVSSPPPHLPPSFLSFWLVFVPLLTTELIRQVLWAAVLFITIRHELRLTINGIDSSEVVEGWVTHTQRHTDIREKVKNRNKEWNIKVRWLTWARMRNRWNSRCCDLAAASESANVTW